METSNGIATATIRLVVEYYDIGHADAPEDLANCARLALERQGVLLHAVRSVSVTEHPAPGPDNAPALGGGR